jgi:hypothetical protein
MHRLTAVQYRNIIRDVFGPTIEVTDDLPTDSFLHGFTTVAAGEATISNRAVEQYEASANGVVEQIFGDTERRLEFVGCQPNIADPSCAREYIGRIGRILWRRTLTEEELTPWVELTETMAQTFREPWVGLRYATTGLLQSSDFLFRVEHGEADPDNPGDRRFSSVDMASRLSFLLWNSTPDEALLIAAESDALTTDEGLVAQVTRLLTDARSQSAIKQFFAEYLQLDRLDHLEKSRDHFPQMSDTLGAAMRREIEEAVGRIVFENDEDIRRLLSTGTTVINEELAALYQLPPVDGWTVVQLPANSARGGLLTMAGFLALNAHNTMTSPTYRGKYVQNRFYCFDVPPPPPGVDTNLGPDAPGAPPTTMRQKLARHSEDEVCNACHQYMDPMGLALENFDAIGAYRTTENGQPIDAGGVVDGQAFIGAQGLSALLVDDPRLGECVTRQFFRHGMGHLEEREEEIIVRALQADFADEGFRFMRLVEALVLSPGFRQVGEVDL